MLIDLHAISSATDSDAAPPDQVIEAAKRSGLGGIAFVDHMFSAHAKQLLEYGEAADFPVFVGVEIVAREGKFLCFSPEIDPFTSREEWRQLLPVGLPPSYAAIRELYDTLGGAVIASQPYLREIGARLADGVAMCDGLDGVEVVSAGVGRFERGMAVEIAVKSGFPTAGGSGQIRRLSEIGDAATLFSKPVATQAELVEELRGRNFWAVEARSQRQKSGRDKRRSDGDKGRRDKKRSGGRSRSRRSSDN